MTKLKTYTDEAFLRNKKVAGKEYYQDFVKHLIRNLPPAEMIGANDSLELKHRKLGQNLARQDFQDLLLEYLIEDTLFTNKGI
jgi:hypothetical protein